MAPASKELIGSKITEVMGEHTHLIFPTIATLVYLFLVPQVANLGISKETVRQFSVVHNALLCIFSAVTFIRCVDVIREVGVVAAKQYYFDNHSAFSNIIYLFYLSKYYEYVDTMIIYAKGGKPIFLQTYHHAGAAWAWHLCYYYRSDAILISTMFNAFVHTIMYFYYLMTLLKVDAVKIIKKYITMMQITQLISGNLLSIVYYFVESGMALYSILLFNVYVYILIGLFMAFMKKTYSAKANGKSE